MDKKAFIPLSLAMVSINAFAQGQRPNIILFMVDDMGWQDTSVPFWSEQTKYNRMFETPNMERLAAQGMMFTQAYSCSISSPSRCSLITGANNARHRVTNWTLEKNVTTDMTSSTIELPEWNYNGISMVPGTERTFVANSFVNVLKQHGYHTIHCGKAHFGAIDTPGEDPHHWGFEVNIAGHAAGGLATYLSEKNFGHTPEGKATSLMSIPDLEEYWGTGVFATEALTREAIKALDKAKLYNQPFFLYMSHYAVHIPIDKDVRFYQKYIDKGVAPKDAAYASLVEGMDKSLGDLMDWLEANGEANNTIVIFMSDNGGLATQPNWRDGEPYTQNFPLFSGKGSLYEGGIREPMIVKWPGIVQEGSKCDKYVMIEDFFPSIIEMADISGETVGDNVDGVSFVPLLRGTGDPSRNRALIWNFPNIWGNDGPGINLNCAIRKGDWKLIYYYETGKKELYNIPDDIAEQHDLSSKYPKIVKKLSSELGKYLRSVGADRPSFKASGSPCPWPDEHQN
ncbi:MAG: sulfatase [Bacteroidales bacterium]|nr:sulfatase [Bacteroidales bacterium]